MRPIPIEVLLGAVLVLTSTLVLRDAWSRLGQRIALITLIGLSVVLILAAPAEAVESVLRPFHGIALIEIACFVAAVQLSHSCPQRLHVGIMLFASGTLALRAVRLVGGWAL